MNTLEIILLCICGMLAIGFIIVRTLRGGILGLLLKTLASFGFVASGIIGLIISDVAGSYKWILGLIIIGLLLGMIGDIVLDLKVIYTGNDKYYLNAGMLSFFLGHICYISAFTVYVNESNLNTTLSIPLTLLLTSGISIILTTAITLSGKRMMRLDFGNYLIQTIGYTFILSFAMVYALILSIMGCGLWLAFIGLLLFFLSDIVLSFQYFGGKLDSKPLISINHALYYTAQIILVAVIFVL